MAKSQKMYLMSKFHEFIDENMYLFQSIGDWFFTHIVDYSWLKLAAALLGLLSKAGVMAFLVNWEPIWRFQTQHYTSAD